MAKRPISIVSPEPGTTRDYVRLRLDMEGVIVDVLDTAGLENVEGATPRALAQELTQEQIHNADLVLYCLSVDDSESEECQVDQCLAPTECSLAPTECSPARQAGPTWLIRTKSDLRSKGRRRPRNYEREFSVSTIHSESIDRVLSGFRDWAAVKMENANQVVPLTAARCQASLNNAVQALVHAKDAAENQRGDEVIASEIRLSLEEIGLVAGTVYTDDILDALFSRFCIGK